MNPQLDILEQIFSLQKFEVDDADYVEFEKKLTFLERLSEVENSSVTVMDIYQKKYTFIRSKYIEKFEDSDNVQSFQDPLHFAQLIHPDDIPFVYDSYKKTFHFVLSLPVEERKDYKLILNFRQLDKRGRYINVILQLVVLELDKKGNIWLVLIIDDLLPDKISFNEINRRLVNIKNGRICLFKNDFENSKTILSNREIEVLGLISKGFVSKEIADKLFLSVNTVNNHRQNILEKIKATNTSEAIAYASNLGLL